MPNTVSSWRDEYARRVRIANVQETRRAFYGGPACMFDGQADADMAQLVAFQAELARFADDVKAGRA
jgi:hypothetical protein